jgi:hypothetical protein
MAKTVAIILSLAMAAALAACDRNGGAATSSTGKSDSAASTGGSPTKPTGTPMQTGEVPAGTSAGDGTKTGVRNTPPPK